MSMGVRGRRWWGRDKKGETSEKGGGLCRMIGNNGLLCNHLQYCIGCQPSSLLLQARTHCGERSVSQPLQSRLLLSPSCRPVTSLSTQVGTQVGVVLLLH